METRKPKCCKMNGCSRTIHPTANKSGYCSTHRVRKCKRCGTKHRTVKSLCMNCRKG